MIKVKGNYLKMEGNDVLLMSEFTSIIDGLLQVFTEKYGAEDAEKKVRYCLDLALIPKDELEKRAKEIMEDLPKRLDKLLDDIRAKLKEEGEGKEND